MTTAILPPQSGSLDQPFWDGLREGRFLLHRCTGCDRRYWPASCCVVHGAAGMRWEDTSGCGEISTYTIFHRAYLPDLADSIPYTVCVVRLDEGPLFHARLQGRGAASPGRGLRVRANLSAAVVDGVPPPFLVDDDFIPKKEP